ncbi:MAG: low molecular weight protein arginine phosphatase [Gemmatimonadota bacterium]
MSGGRPVRILFVCTGNTCRSPLAEWIALTEAKRRGWHHLEVRSAGTLAGAGYAASRTAELVAQERGVDVAEHRSRPLTAAGVGWADLVVGMSPGHLQAALSLDSGAAAALATDYLAPDHPERGRPVPDPIGGERAVYERTFDLLTECVQGLFDRLGAGGLPRAREGGRSEGG